VRPALVAGAMTLMGVAGLLAATQAGVAARAGEPEVQRVEIEAGSRGFVPDTVRLVAGRPADLVFTRTSSSRCVAEVHIPDLGIGKTPLVQGEPVAIRIEKPGSGVYEFRCGMNMLRGTIVVAPAAKP
jgi:P-type Cu+ transporter